MKGCHFLREQFKRVPLFIQPTAWTHGSSWKKTHHRPQVISVGQFVFQWISLLIIVSPSKHAHDTVFPATFVALIAFPDFDFSTQLREAGLSDAGYSIGSERPRAWYKVFAFIVHIVFFILSVVVCGIDVINVLVSGPELNLRSRNETLVEYGPFCPIRMHVHVTWYRRGEKDF